MNEISLVANSAPFGALATKPLFKRCHFKIVMGDVRTGCMLQIHLHR